MGIFAAVRLVKPPSKPEPAPEGPSPHEIQGEGPKAGQDETIWPEPNTDAQTILDYRIGGLYLGMSRQEVLDLLGEPASKEKAVYSDGSVHESWRYKLSDAQTSREDFTLDLADAGDGWILNAIICFENCTLALPHGIRMGMTNEELLEVWPELRKEFLVDSRIALTEYDGTEHPATSYTQYHEHLHFGMILNDNKFDYLSLGTYYPDPPWDEPASDEDTKKLLDYRFGPLYLGMPFDDVKALYGEPTVTSNSGPITYEDGIARDSAGYKLAEGTERRSDLSLQLADAGDGWVVNEILLWENCGLELPHGVKLGMTDAELRAVWPEIAEEARYEADAGEGEKNGMKYTCSSYSQSSGHLRFGIYLENGVVYCVDLGLYYEDPPWEVDTPAPEEPYSFSSGEITVWRRTDEGWESTLKTEHGAKVLETVFSIEDLVPLEDELWPVQYVVDFQNGTVCLVCAPQEGVTAGPNTPPDAWGAVYHLEDRDAFEASMAGGEAAPQGLTRLETCIFPYGTWDTLSEAFE